MSVLSSARLRINAKVTDVCQTYREAIDAKDSVEATIDALAKKHKCTRDSIRKIITRYRAGKIKL